MVIFYLALFTFPFQKLIRGPYMPTFSGHLHQVSWLAPVTNWVSLVERPANLAMSQHPKWRALVGSPHPALWSLAQPQALRTLPSFWMGTH